MNKELIKSLYEIGAIKFGDFTLKSGKKSPYYVDLRILSSYPKVLNEVGRLMGEMIKRLPEKPTCLCGIPMAGLAIANVIGIETETPVIYTRKEPIIYRDIAKKFTKFINEGEYRKNEIIGVRKAITTLEGLSGFKTHGITRYVDGIIKNGDKIGIIDDLITTADSKLEARDLIILDAKRRDIKVDVIGVYVLLDREQGGKETINNEGLDFHSLINISDVIECLYNEGMLNLQKFNIVKNYINS